MSGNGGNSWEDPLPVGQYMKFVDGANQIRILEVKEGVSLVRGFEVWINKKPARFNVGDVSDVPKSAKDMADIDEKKGTKKPPRFFWAFFVWNYAEEKIQLLELTQKGIIEAIQGLTKNPKWGSPYSYDIVVTKSGTDLATKYTVTPDPKSDLDPAIEEKFTGAPVDLYELFNDGDPFNPTHQTGA